MDRRRQASGLVLAVAAALAFGVGGPLVRPLLDAGWTSSAAVLARCVGVFVVLAIPAVVLLRGRWDVLVTNARTIAAYGAFAVLVPQLCYYTAIRFVPVGVALLIQYLAPVLLVVWVWATTRRRPGALVLAGCVTAVLGLLLVVDLGGASATAPVGVVLALTAAVGTAVYYVVNARIDPRLPIVALLAASMLVAIAILLLLGLTGVTPLRVALTDVPLLGAAVPWWLPLALVVGVSTLAGYLLGIAGSARLGSRVASFVGLLEVLFAVLTAWLLLGDLPAPVQFAGGALILIGVVLVRSQREARGERTPRAAPIGPRDRPALALRPRSANTREAPRSRT